MSLTGLPRRLAFAGDARLSVALSPDGMRFAWLRAGGGRRLAVAPAERPGAARALGPEGVSPVLFWAGDNHVLLFRDGTGDENWQALAVDVATGAACVLTPPGARALFLRATRREALFALNDRDPATADLVAVGLTDGALRRVYDNRDGFSRIHADAALRPVLAERVRDDGSIALLRRAGAGWTTCAEIPLDDALSTRVVGLEGGTAWLVDSRDRDRAALTALALATGETRLLAQDESADIDRVVFRPESGPVAAAATAARRRWQAVSPALARSVAALGACDCGGEADLLGVSRALGRVHVQIAPSDGPTEHRLLDKAGAVLARLKARDDLAGVALAAMAVVGLRARDGLPMVGYLTLPAAPHGPGPLVLAVHGGPYDRDEWGFAPTHQWLASRGYAVLSVNFRGSTGFGKSFVASADREWGGQMQSDLVDAVGWAVAEGIADPVRIGILGASYGGYAALMAGAQAPGVFACVAAMNAPTSLVNFMAAIPPYWRSWFAVIRRRLADPATEAGRQWLEARSPLSQVGCMRRPVLLMQGAHDVRVQAAEAREMAAALAAAGVPVSLAMFPDEGHFLDRTPNRIGFAALVEAFLAQHLGGTVEPVAGDLLASSLVLEAGGEFLPAAVAATLAARLAPS